MQSLSLKAGLSFLICAVLIATLLINVVIQAMHAAPRARNELESNSRLTRELVIMTIAALRDVEDPVGALRRLYESFGRLRHVEIMALGPSERMPPLAMAMRPRANQPPAWFVELVGAAPTVTLAPITVNGRAFGRIAIISDPLDELAEVWSDMKWLAAISLIVTFVMFALVILILRRSLRPFDALRAGLTKLEAGTSGVRIPPQGAAEFQAIASALNSLAETLDRVRRENRALMTKLLDAHESERREIARDLHDEAGPVLFSIRASSVALQELITERDLDAPKLRQHGISIDRAVAALQAVMRDLLNRLRLTGVGEGGLNDALMILVAAWRERRPELRLELLLPHDLSAVDAASSAAAYRIVQEGLTNVFRHSEATSARVTVEFGALSDAGDELEEASAPALVVIVEDDGIGIRSQFASGLGLLGIRERVDALSGLLVVESGDGKGTRIRAALPLSEDEGE